MDRERLATGIAIVVVAVWVASLVLDAASATYDPPPTVHAAVMVVVGWVFGERLLKRKNGNGGS